MYKAWALEKDGDKEGMIINHRAVVPWWPKWLCRVLVVCLKGRYREDQHLTFPSFLLWVIPTEDVLANVKKAYCTCCRGLTLCVIPGSLGQLITLRGRLPEDLSLHYQLQVLTALEYLAKKRVVHLDIKGMLHRVKFYVVSLDFRKLTPCLKCCMSWFWAPVKPWKKTETEKKRFTPFKRRPTVSRLKKSSWIHRVTFIIIGIRSVNGSSC